jgi:membrane protease YdiL (CAAX protease family)
MHVPGSMSLLFLVYLLVLMPYAAIRSAGVIRAARAGTSEQPLPSRESIWVRTIFVLGFLFALAWYTGRGFDFHIFALPPLGVRDIAAAVGALAAYFGLREVSRAIRSEAERRAMLVYFIAPRSTREWFLWTGTVLVASVAEEAAYRGVGMAILWYALGNPYAAVAICSVAFALAHWTQGWKSAAVIFVMALVMHALVAFTGTLILAMLVHGIYDLVAGYFIAKEAKRLQLEGREASLEAPRASPSPDERARGQG